MRHSKATQFTENELQMKQKKIVCRFKLNPCHNSEIVKKLFSVYSLNFHLEPFFLPCHLHSLYQHIYSSIFQHFGVSAIHISLRKKTFGNNMYTSPISNEFI